MRTIPCVSLRALEAEGWMEHLFPALNSTRANTTALAELADRQGLLQVQGILAQSAALAFPLITAKMPAPDVSALKALLVRPGFVQDIDGVDARVRDFAAKLSSKEYAAPSAVWKLLHASEPNLVLALFYSSKSAAVQARVKTFLSESPQTRQRIPYALMGEMRITSDLSGYADLVDKLFYELMDGKLSTPEEMKAYLEPYSPPAPPPPVNLRRARARKEARPSRAKAKKAAAGDAMSVAAEEEAVGIHEGLMEEGDLTGPDRGPEPTVVTPLSKVAPEMPAVAKKTSAPSIPADVGAPARAAVPAPTKAAPAKQTPASKDVPKKTVAPSKAVSAKAIAAVKPASAKTVVLAKKAPAPAKKSAPEVKAVPAASKKAGSVSKSVGKVVSAAKGVKAVAINQPARKAGPAKKTGAKAVVAKKSGPAKAAVKKGVPPRTASKQAAPAKGSPKKQVAAKKSSRR